MVRTYHGEPQLSGVDFFIVFDCRFVDFEDSLNLTPKPAFDPKIQPDRAILKASASKTVNIVARTPKKQLFSKQKRSPKFV